MKNIVRFLVAASLLLFGACATVHPWDRDLLAQEKMSFNPHPMMQSVDEHIYFSKEASMGGIDVGGGGCGCN
ncbi:MAG TPA: DUF4266 domain-containing protein [Thermoanaerobaculia bacterium]|jgi:hypothetical protein|nr:DUF4266 domain-containing protein [Thermoanaerobaculia bacterium]